MWRRTTFPRGPGASERPQVRPQEPRAGPELQQNVRDAVVRRFWRADSRCRSEGARAGWKSAVQKDSAARSLAFAQFIG